VRRENCAEVNLEIRIHTQILFLIRHAFSLQEVRLQYRVSEGLGVMKAEGTAA